MTASAPPLALTLDPPFPCDSVMIHGTGFGPGRLSLVFTQVRTRFGDGPTTTMIATADAAGTFSQALTHDQLTGLEGETYLSVIDPATNREARTAVPLCNPGLEAALEASSVPLATAGVR